MRRWLRAMVGLVWGLAWAAATSAQEPAAAPRAEVSWAQLERASCRYRHEPTLSALIAAALRAQRVCPDCVAELAGRARVSGWLPTLRLSARRGQTIDLLAAQSTTQDRNSASSGDDLVLEAQLMFDLGKVVWSGQEPRIERERRAERQAQETLVRTVSTLHAERRRLQLSRDVLDAADLDDFVRLQEIEGLLDALTGGAIRRATRRGATSSSCNSSAEATGTLRAP